MDRLSVLFPLRNIYFVILLIIIITIMVKIQFVLSFNTVLPYAIFSVDSKKYFVKKIVYMYVYVFTCVLKYEIKTKKPP